ncbi:hypothetical protein NDU88_001420 [Pleurodeles waltl]|uniref:Uncharacterized protein n=1 Tax=Pleurodeles waltl TaxID=8319 RepID=A0AAV7MLN1_PLEWA|nr:hypothetical protein NDU88_001420 [Pleurodeles waltl]
MNMRILEHLRTPSAVLVRHWQCVPEREGQRSPLPRHQWTGGKQITTSHSYSQQQPKEEPQQQLLRDRQPVWRQPGKEAKPAGTQARDEAPAAQPEPAHRPSPPADTSEPAAAQQRGRASSCPGLSRQKRPEAALQPGAGPQPAEPRARPEPAAGPEPAAVARGVPPAALYLARQGGVAHPPPPPPLTPGLFLWRIVKPERDGRVRDGGGEER